MCVILNKNKMKKIALISVGVIAVGGIAYLIFMSKKKKEPLLKEVTGTSAGATTTTTTGVGASPINSEIPPLSTGGIVTTTTKAPSIEEQKKLDQANDIVDKIKKLYLISSTKKPSTLGSSSGIFAKNILKDTFTNSPSLAITRYKDQLLKLGYEYKGGKDGILVKL